MAFPSMLIKPRDTERPRPMVRLIGRVAALAGLALLILPAGGATPAPPQAPLIFGTDAVETNEFGSKWATLAYTEAFRRLDLPVQINHYPLARRTALVESGEIDGDVARIREYGDAHPSMVRVEESFADLNFALFSANPALQLQTVEELRPGNWQVEYRRSILFCEGTLKPLLPAERLSDWHELKASDGLMVVGGCRGVTDGAFPFGADAFAHLDFDGFAGLVQASDNVDEAGEVVTLVE